MQAIPIQAVPNQAFSIVLDENRWDIAIRATSGGISFSFARNNVQLVDNLHAVAGMRLIPSKYQEAGNFVLTTTDEQVPDYTQFDVTQYLIYASQAELDSLRVPTAPPMTAADFDPLGGLPLRFAPQGYTLA